MFLKEKKNMMQLKQKSRLSVRNKYLQGVSMVAPFFVFEKLGEIIHLIM